MPIAVFDDQPSADVPQDGMALHVVVAGGGVAALETVLALRDLAGDRVRVTVLSPAAEYVDRPMSVREPFGHGAARHYPLTDLVADMGAQLIPDTLDRVDPVGRRAHTAGGRVLEYDALVIAVGATIVKSYEHATTIDGHNLDELLHGVVEDIEGGFVHHMAFVVPKRMAWPLPIYELALMAAERAYDASATLSITIVTPERAPLAVFGVGASLALAGLLEEAGIALITGTTAAVPAAGRVDAGRPHGMLEVDRVVALPELFGPSVRGVPKGAHGFIPVDPYGRVIGAEDLFAAGDATDYPIKFGGVAAQQAEAVAQVIAQRAGADVTPRPLRAELHGTLITGAAPLHLSARAAGDTGFDSEISESPVTPSATKIAARRLSPFLLAHDTHRGLRAVVRQ